MTYITVLENQLISSRDGYSCWGKGEAFVTFMIIAMHAQRCSCTISHNGEVVHLCFYA
jgi:hypothetical protein